MIKTYGKLIGLGVALTGTVSVFSAIGMICQLNELGMLGLQILALMLVASALVVYMKKRDHTLAKFGFEKGKIDVITLAFMCLIVAVQPVLLGIDPSVSGMTFLLIVIQMLLVGFVEESLFRAIFFFYLSKNTKNYLWFSSITFGLLHAVNGMNPNMSWLLVLLQVANALLLGVVFSLIYLKTKSIYPTIFFHALFNIFASILFNQGIEETILTVSLLLLIDIGFIFYLLKSQKIAN